MADFKDFVEALKNELIGIAEEAAVDIKDELIEDGEAFARKAKEDIQRWMTLFAQGMLTQEEVAYLIKGKKDLAAMEALKQKGLAEARIDRLKNALISSVIDAVFKVLP